jgi:DNA-binding XRE family transcriptional regulator
MAQVIALPSSPLLPLDEFRELPLFERIRYVRKDIVGVTQARFALLVGVNLRTVKGWEHPDAPRGAPSLENAVVLERLAGGRYPASLFMGPPPLEQIIAQQILDEVRALDTKVTRLLDHFGL